MNERLQRLPGPGGESRQEAAEAAYEEQDEPGGSLGEPVPNEPGTGPEDDLLAGTLPGDYKDEGDGSIPNEEPLRQARPSGGEGRRKGRVPPPEKTLEEQRRELEEEMGQNESTRRRRTPRPWSERRHFG